MPFLPVHHRTTNLNTAARQIQSVKPRAFAPLALLLILLTAAPVQAEGDVTLTALDSGISVTITDSGVATNLTELLGPNGPWLPLTADDSFRRTHVILIGDSHYYYAEGTGTYAGAVIWPDRDQEKYFILDDVNTLLAPYLERITQVEGEVAVARTLQILAGVALAVLVCVLLYIGMREEKKPQVLR